MRHIYQTPDVMIIQVDYDSMLLAGSVKGIDFPNKTLEIIDEGTTAEGATVLGKFSNVWEEDDLVNE